MPLTSRERVLTALAHEEPDRVPIVIGVSNATGIKMAPYRELKRIIGVDAPETYMYDWPELGTAAVDEATMRRLHVDVRGVLDLEPAAVLERNRTREPHSDYINSWGSGAVEIAPDDWFPMVEPLADATTLDAIERYPWPDMDDPTRVAHMGAEAARPVADVQAGLGRGVRPTVLPFESMIPALDEVGRRFESGEYFLPEMLIAARAMRASMEVLRPHMSATDAPSLGTVVMGTVAGDIHDIGKVGMSAFLTTTMPQIGRTIAAIRAAGLRDEVRIIIGGAPINDAFAMEFGADGYAPDASSAVRVTKALLA